MAKVRSAVVDIPVLWLYGADAAGKSTVGWEVYTRLAGSGQAAAYLDIDYLGFCTPQPGGDPTWLVERNLAAMWATFAEAGARCLVAAGVVVSRQQWRRYAAATAPGQLLTLRAGQAVRTHARVEVCLAYPVPDRGLGQIEILAT